MNILAMIWGKTATVIVGLVGILAALAGIRHSIRKGKESEMRAEIQKRTLDRIEAADKAERDIAGADRTDIIDKLRDQGHIRD
ncbi:MAG: hypothetical protein KJN90_12950 [Gammaproteobacteria bacterium]|nr:hypothetical protein [Gammaproteobacteria bacterium]